MRFGSNYVLSVVEELCFTNGCDSDALSVLGSIDMGTTRKYLIRFTTDFNFGVFCKFILPRRTMVGQVITVMNTHIHRRLCDCNHHNHHN
jgi:hypothetical protein